MWIEHYVFFISDFFMFWGCTVLRFNISPPSLRKKIWKGMDTLSQDSWISAKLEHSTQGGHTGESEVESWRAQGAG
jgi:hypothetical protein